MGAKTKKPTIEVGELKCENCHSDLAKLTRPVSRSAFPTRETAKMDWCVGCHKRKHVTTDCLTCHR